MFLKTKTKQFSVEELIQGAQDEMNLEQIEDAKDKTFDPKIERWRCHKCSDGLLKLIIIPGNRYFRKCGSCENRTEIKQLNDEVDMGV